MRALVFANGIFHDGAMARRHLAAFNDPCVICADGGALIARDLGYAPAVIIGDFDSLAPEQVAHFQARGAEIIRHGADKDETDLELALRLALARGAEAATIIGALGGRIDQTIANISLLALPEFRAMPIVLVDGAQSLRLLLPGAHVFTGGAGDTISLLPFSASADGITTRGLRYPLRGESLPLGPARGVSNVMLANRAEITHERGLLLLVHSIGRA